MFTTEHGVFEKPDTSLLVQKNSSFIDFFFTYPNQIETRAYTEPLETTALFTCYFSEKYFNIILPRTHRSSKFSVYL
jgi:hypothetical protein